MRHTRQNAVHAAKVPTQPRIAGHVSAAIGQEVTFPRIAQRTESWARGLPGRLPKWLPKWLVHRECLHHRVQCRSMHHSTVHSSTHRVLRTTNLTIVVDTTTWAHVRHYGSTVRADFVDQSFLLLFHLSGIELSSGGQDADLELQQNPVLVAWKRT